jgi:hypothetical protein
MLLTILIIAQGNNYTIKYPLGRVQLILYAAATYASVRAIKALAADSQ